MGCRPWKRSAAASGALGAGVVATIVAMGGAAFAQTDAAPSGAPPKRVLVVHSFGAHFEPYRTAGSSFRTALALQSREPVEFYEVSLETARFDDQKLDGPISEYLRALIAAQPIDLVVPIASPALRFCADHRDRLFPNVPMLAFATEKRRLEGVDLGANATSVGFSIDDLGFVDDLFGLLPDTKHVYVVFGDAPLERYWVAETRRRWAPYENRASFTWLNDLVFTEVLERVASLPTGSVVIFGTMDVDAAGVPYEQQTAIAMLRAAANAPIFGFFAHDLGHGIVGGRLVHLDDISREGARAAVRILEGERASSIPSTIVPPGASAFDWRELERWGIRAERLPAGAEIHFREPTLWQAYRWQIVGIGAFVAVEGLLIVLLLAGRSRLRAAKEELRESNAHVNVAARAARLGLWRWDVRSDRVWITQEGRDLFGWNANEAIDFERFIATLHPEHRDDARRRLGEALAGEGDFEGEHKLAANADRWLATRGQVDFDASGKPVSVHGVSMDVTARKRAVVEADELRSELAHVDRLSLVGQFAASLAHELGQPLGAILRNADAAELFLKSASPDLEEIGAILDDIRKDDRRAADVIDRLRALLKRRRLEMHPVSLRDSVADVLSIAGTDAVAREVIMTSNIPADLPTVHADRVHIQQVLLNLVSNAMDAVNGENGAPRTVDVRARRADGGWVEVSVRDTGSGIAPDRLMRVFEPFHTSKPAGMGMGLPISRSIVEAHGGRLWVERNPDRGVTFRFTLPVAPVEVHT